MWGGVKAESIVIGANRPEEPEEEAPPLIIRRYPAAIDDRETDNVAARERFNSEKQELRRVAKEAEERAARHERLLAAQRIQDEKDRVAQVAKDEAIRIAVREEHAKKEAQKVVSRSDKPQEPSIVFEATSYIALCDTGCTGKTATGVDVRNTNYEQGHRVIAVDPSVIPLGSIVRVTVGSNSFTAIAADTGGDIKGYRVDILVSTTEEARAFGRQNVAIKIIRNGAK